MPILVREYILLGETCQDPAWRAALADIPVVATPQASPDNIVVQRQPKLIGGDQLADYVTSLLVDPGR